eukprot:4641932-Pleurochrysis_carterae.AAC.3
MIAQAIQMRSWFIHRRVQQAEQRKEYFEWKQAYRPASSPFQPRSVIGAPASNHTPHEWLLARECMVGDKK